MHTDPVAPFPEPVPAPGRALPRGAVAAVVVGAIWRIGVLVVDKWHQPLLLNDSFYYSAQARQLANGQWFREIFVDQPGAEHGPLTSVLMSFVSWTHDPLPWQRTVTVACGIATIAVLAVLGGRIGGPRVATGAAWIAALYPNLWMNDGLVMSESVSVLMVCVVLVLAHRVATGPPAPTSRSIAALGAAAGLAALARSELAVLIPALAVFLWCVVGRRQPKPARRVIHRSMLGVVLAAVIVMAPWVVFNLVRFERPVTLTTNDGTTLLGSYCDRTFGGPEVGGWSVFCVTEDDPDYAMNEEPSVRSARQRHLALTYARHHLDALPRVMAARVGRTLDVVGLGSLVAQDVGEERYRWASWSGIASWWLLSVTAVFGVRRVQRFERWLLALPVISVAVTTIVFYGGHRIRSSMEPTVVILAAVAIAAAASNLERRRAP